MCFRFIQGFFFRDFYRGGVSGICGDFNADASDDLKRRDGLNMQQIGVDAFAAMVQSWQVLENDIDSDSR
jgi:hypothetical protein